MDSSFYYDTKKTCIAIAFMLIKPLVVFFNLSGNSMNVLPHNGL